MVTGLSLGYLNRPDLTEDKFIKNPFGEGNIYKTGDLVTFLPNGSINYIGRIDNQIKLRGFRIELSEIDNRILEFAGVKESATIINSGSIYSYIVCDHDFSIPNLEKYLRSALPSFMIPTSIIKLDALPVNVNGKLDKKNLPLPSLMLEKREIVPARNDIDKAIISELKQILHIDNISIKDSFFGIGGDSLNAITLCTHLSHRLGLSISVKDVFDNPIIEHLSDFVSNNNFMETSKTISRVNDSTYYPLSCAQKRIYYAHTLSLKNGIVYNVSGGIVFNRILDTSKVQDALNKLIRLHTSFRTVFKYEDGEIVQSILDNVSIDLEVESSSLDVQTLVDNFPTAFDLSKAPLLRAKLVILNNSSSMLLLDSHHIIVDGTSLNIIFNDFCKLYNGEVLKENDLRYVDYAVWEKDFINSDKIKSYEEFWTNKFKGEEFTALNLPYDFPLSNVKSYKGDRLSLSLSKEEFNSLEEIAKKNNVSSYSVFLAGLYILLYKYTAQNYIVIGSPFAGRSFKEVQDIIGMFVNNIVFNKHIDENLNFSDFVKSVHADVIDSISNQPYPYELLQKNLNLGSNNSLLDVMFTYQNINTERPQINGISSKFLTPNTKTSKFNLWFEIIPSLGVFNLEFNTDLFKFETAESILKHYLFILKQLIKNEDIKPKDVSMITDEEDKLLEKFNDTYMEISDDTTIVSIFEGQVKKTPNNIAVVCDDKSLTYNELNTKANSLAHYLINYGIKENDIVCIMTNRSLETIVSMLGILKAGAAFFNVDPTYPQDRTKYYIEDSHTKYVLTQKELKDRALQIKNTIEIDLSNTEIYGKEFNNPNIKVDKNSLSYIIYTSGSTRTA